MEDLQTRIAALNLESDVPDVPGADSSTRPLDIYRLHLATILATSLGCDHTTAYNAITLANDIGDWDLTVVVPKLQLTDAPSAFEIPARLSRSPLFLVPWADGDAQLRFLINTKTLGPLLLPYIGQRQSTYGQDHALGLADSTSSEQRKRKVVVEFSSPNIPGEFTGNHLRSTLLGAFVANIHECMGWDVVRLNYLGDWGKHSALFAIGWEKFGDDALLKEDPEGHILTVFDKINQLFEPELKASRQAKKENQNTAEIESQGLFAERDEVFKKMEHHDEATITQWERFRDIHIERGLKPAYDRLGVRFDAYSGESRVKSETMVEIENILKEKGVTKESDGSWIIKFAEHGAKGLRTQILRSRTGSSTYLLRDVAAVLDRDREYAFDKMIYVVSSRQHSHFQQVFKVLELIDRSDLAAKLQHVSFGEIQDMKAHLPEPLTLSRILDSCGDLKRKAARDADEDISDEALATIGDRTAISGLLSQDFSGKRMSGYAFIPEKITTFDGDSGVKLQRDHTRLALAITELGTEETRTAEPAYESLTDTNSTNILRILCQYPDVTLGVYKSLEPHALLTVLAHLCDAVTESLDGEGEGDDDEDIAGGSSQNVQRDGTGFQRAKLDLLEKAKIVLENGMHLLGLPVV